MVLLARMLLVMTLGLAASSQATSPAVLWLHAGSDGERSEALLLETDVDIAVSGLLAESSVRQRFYNDSGQWAEGRYVFPLPDDSVVERLQIIIGDRLIEGEIQERGQARQTFEQARASGRATGLVEQERANVFSTSVANIPPGEEVEIRIGFRQAVDFEHGRFSLRFPTTIAPRFIPGHAMPVSVDNGGGWAADTDQVPDASRISPPVAHPDAGPWNPLRLNVTLRPGMPLASVESSFHPINMSTDGSKWQVSLAHGADSSGRDFELVWRPTATGLLHSAVFSERHGNRDHALLMMIPPQEFSTRQTPREVILIVDTSGSMRGDPMDQARQSLDFALDRLGPNDRFNVIEFNHLTRALFETTQPAGNARLQQARRWIGQLQASGGTVMGPSLSMALAQAIPDGYLRQVVFVTDGVIGNEREVLDQVRREIGNSRLFPVGLGHGVNSQFLRDAARHGRGSYTFIGEMQQINERMSELISQLQSPVLHDIELHWPTQVEAYPNRIPDLYVGQPLMVSARLDRLQGDLLITGQSDGQHWQEVVPLETFHSAPGVASHWAGRRIQALEDHGRQDDDAERLRADLLATAIEYQLVSPLTSLVAVDRTPQRSQQLALRRHELPTNLPHGRTLEGFFSAGAQHRAMPATDGGTGPSLLRGLIALLLIVLLFAQKQINRDEDQGPGEPL